MVNAPHLFEDLKLRDVGEVEGNTSGLDIKGMGTFKFKIKDYDTYVMNSNTPHHTLYDEEYFRRRRGIRTS
jgi:hypothetical protein